MEYTDNFCDNVTVKIIQERFKNLEFLSVESVNLGRRDRGINNAGAFVISRFRGLEELTISKCGGIM